MDLNRYYDGYPLLCRSLHWTEREGKRYPQRRKDGGLRRHRIPHRILDRNVNLKRDYTLCLSKTPRKLLRHANKPMEGGKVNVVFILNDFVCCLQSE